MPGAKVSIRNELCDIDKELDRGAVSDANLLRRLELNRRLHDINLMEAKDSIQKSKVKWTIEGDENSKFFHGCRKFKLLIWKYWNFVGPDFSEAVEYFFVNGSFPKGCNSSFVALIPKVTDAKFVNDFLPISLIGCVYKVVQSAFVAGRQILDGPFILNEILHWCKRKKKQAMFFKVNFAKAYDSVRWDYLLDVLEAFGFGQTWCKWVRGTFSSAKASILVNGSPSNEFSFHRGPKQGDPLSPY
ncbi:RNA-directed DNA polymerase, eukaryota, partial [Tanacetum coccineum]